MPRSFTNPDRITWLVLPRVAIAALVAVLAAWGIDLNLDEKKQGAVADALLVVVPILLTLAGAVWGSKDAAKRVTPIPTAEDERVEKETGIAPVIPTDRHGRALRPVDHGAAGGYPPTRAATEAERRPRRRQLPTDF